MGYWEVRNIEKQKELIHSDDWDVLIVIDACRYDYFKKYHAKILNNGNLKPVESSASWTGAWIAETFHNKIMLDTVFISTIPWLKSDGPSIEKVRSFKERLKYVKMLRDINITKQFKEIVDVWKIGTKDLKHYSQLEQTTDETIKAIEQNPKSRVIVKYWQIHEPYMYFGDDKPVTKLSFENLQLLIAEIIGDEVLCKIRNCTGELPINALSYYYIKHGKEGIQKAYSEDLKTTLKSIKKIIDRFPNKKFAITSDHGEKLGEEGDFGHSGPKDKIIAEVPWYTYND